MGANLSSVVDDDSIKLNRVDFFLNGQQYHVNVESDANKINPQSMLVDFIRDNAGLKGTKYMCREGGCGACVVTVRSKDPSSGKYVFRALNSCLVPVFSADGWEITTVEGLGDKRKGYHKIQEQVVKFNASQCGFCTPGMVMNFYGLDLNRNPTFKMQDVEDAFDGNICRCTGYRPILDGFKAMSGDASEELRRKMPFGGCSSENACCKIRDDTEDDNACTSDFDNCSSSPDTKIYLNLRTGEKWIRTPNLSTLFEAMQHFVSSGLKYCVIAGNTGSGVYKNEGPYEGYIDINAVAELKNSVLSSTKGVEIGAGVTLSDSINIFQKASELPGYSYMLQICKHLKRVANTPVRNAGTLGGNLMLKHFHSDFPSDIFVILDCVGAKLQIGSSTTVTREYSLQDFRTVDMRGKIILSIKFPSWGENYYFKTYKISRRFQNAHAYVNCAILMKIDPKRNFSVRDKPSIVFGGISGDFSHAIGTEIYFVGKFLNGRTIDGAMSSLDKEIQPSSTPLDDPVYRKILAQALLYKFILGIMGDSVKSRNQSGALEIDRYIMSGKQDFDTDESQWPLYQPISKIEGKYQASGEAEYVNDMPKCFGELFGAFVITNVANAKIKNVDASEALAMPGVARFIQAKDVPGINNAAIFYPEPEEIFISEKVQFAGQAVGLILAESKDIAFAAVAKVSVVYSDVKKPILTLSQSLRQAEDEGRLEQCKILDMRKLSLKEERFSPEAEVTTIRGEFEIGGQYHFHMETQTCLCVPKEDGMDVFSATQFPHGVQTIVAAALGVPVNEISLSVRRLGGGYGAKISKATQVAAACAIGAKLANRPVRIVMDLQTNMKMIGKRLPYLAKYEVSVDRGSGKIRNLKCDIFCDPGCVGNEQTSFYALLSLQNCYRAMGWEATPGKGITDTHPNTYCRAPGSTQGVAIIETIMEHIASALSMDPLDVRVANFIHDGDEVFGIPGVKFQGENPLPKMIKDLKGSSAFDERKPFVDNFNKNNRWKKRGLSIVPMRYPNHYPDLVLRFPVFISVYAADGTVNVSHGGIEMGQGINTKCAQVVAHILNIPIGAVKIQPTSTLISPNGGITGGAITSELVCHAAVQCCKQLLAKMEPVKASLDNPTWKELVMACYKNHILLTAQHQDKLNDVIPYDIWGVTLTEVELDVLTGEFKIVRVDLIEDAGKSLSPNVDVGQIEGAFVMGLGLWVGEKLTYDKNTGELLTCNTWNYKPPLPRDIPEDFRITMMRNRENPYGVLGSKATGESPLTMSVSVLFALRYAIKSARLDAGNSDYFQMDAPATPEVLQKLALTSKDDFKI